MNLILIFLGLLLMTPNLHAEEEETPCCMMEEMPYVAEVSYYCEMEEMEETITWPGKQEDSFMDALRR